MGKQKMKNHQKWPQMTLKWPWVTFKWPWDPRQLFHSKRISRPMAISPNGYLAQRISRPMYISPNGDLTQVNIKKSYPTFFSKKIFFSKIKIFLIATRKNPIDSFFLLRWEVDKLYRVCSTPTPFLIGNYGNIVVVLIDFRKKLNILGKNHGSYKNECNLSS